MSQPGAPESRIGDAEREAALSALGEHFAAGRLTKEELDERSERAWAARTAGDLAPLFADLPRSTASQAGSTAAPRRGHPGRHGAGMAPVLVVVGVLVVLTHLPVLVLVALAWVFVARMHHFWGDNRRHHHLHRLR